MGTVTQTVVALPGAIVRVLLTGGLDEQHAYGQRAVEWLRALSESEQIADVPEEKADLMQASYERIMVAVPEIVGVRLTAAAYAHGLALALPEKVVLARPTGVGRADDRNIRMPIEGAGDWPRSSGSA